MEDACRKISPDSIASMRIDNEDILEIENAVSFPGVESRVCIAKFSQPRFDSLTGETLWLSLIMEGGIKVQEISVYD